MRMDAPLLTPDVHHVVDTMIEDKISKHLLASQDNLVRSHRLEDRVSVLESAIDPAATFMSPTRRNLMHTLQTPTEDRPAVSHVGRSVTSSGKVEVEASMVETINKDRAELSKALNESIKLSKKTQRKLTRLNDGDEELRNSLRKTTQDTRADVEVIKAALTADQEAVQTLAASVAEIKAVVGSKDLDALASRVESLESKATTQTSTESAKTAKDFKRLKKQVEIMQTQVQESIATTQAKDDDAKQAFSSTMKNLEADVNDRVTRLMRESLDTRFMSMERRVDQIGEDTRKIIAQQEERIADTIEKVPKIMQAESERVRSDISNKFDGQLAQVSRDTDESLTAIKRLVDDNVTVITDHVAKLQESVIKQRDAAVALQEQSQKEIIDQLGEILMKQEAKIKAISDRSADMTKIVDEKLSGNDAKMSERIQTFAKVVEGIGSKLNEVSPAVSKTQNDVKGIVELLNRMHNQRDADLETAEKKFSAVTDAVEKLSGQQGEAVGRVKSLEDDTAKITNAVVQISDRLETGLSANAQAISGLTTRADAADQKVAAILEAAKTMDADMVTVTKAEQDLRAIVVALAERITVLEKELVTKAEDAVVTEQIATKFDSAMQAVESTRQTWTEAREADLKSATVANDQVREAISRLQEQSQAADDTLAEQLSSVSEKASTAIAEVKAGASADLDREIAAVKGDLSQIPPALRQLEDKQAKLADHFSGKLEPIGEKIHALDIRIQANASAVERTSESTAQAIDRAREEQSANQAKLAEDVVEKLGDVRRAVAEDLDAVTTEVQDKVGQISEKISSVSRDMTGTSDSLVRTVAEHTTKLEKLDSTTTSLEKQAQTTDANLRKMNKSLEAIEGDIRIQLQDTREESREQVTRLIQDVSEDLSRQQNALRVDVTQEIADMVADISATTNTKMNQVANRLDESTSELKAVKLSVTDLSDSLEAKIEAVSEAAKDTAEITSEIRKVKDLADSAQKGLGDAKTKFEGKTRELSTKLDGLETKVNASATAVSKHDEMIDKLDRGVDQAKASIGNTTKMVEQTRARLKDFGSTFQAISTLVSAHDAALCEVSAEVLHLCEAGESGTVTPANASTIGQLAAFHRRSGAEERAQVKSLTSSIQQVTMGHASGASVRLDDVITPEFGSASRSRANYRRASRVSVLDDVNEMR
ncbi:hypothetical protein J8273_2133 [Carpediemonas membranifera]|uniref:Apolipoprotein A1/A4/E domain-containing protein n=1 Tax=Carpediemonas membranifera TaxID=201153 RepID=A0A8J6BFJ0_9EUKA|nr:hypothetical protein J8273_2133 [Carpediemonas membranifera]|eukprot:KAG9396402.1 hypothetical protein J8273_2133 [Carpediemonas membranifera]